MPDKNLKRIKSRSTSNLHDHSIASVIEVRVCASNRFIHRLIDRWNVVLVRGSKYNLIRDLRLNHHWRAVVSILIPKDPSRDENKDREKYPRVSRHSNDLD